MLPLFDENPTQHRPWVTYALIAVTVGVYVYQNLATADGEELLYTYGFVPAALSGDAASSIPAPLTLVTSIFFHGSLLHLATNLLYLWVFGNNVEEAQGHGRFILFYLLCGIGAALTQGVIGPSSTVPMVGASGAISGILGAYLLLFPFARILVVIPIGIILFPARLSAYWVLGSWFLLQVGAAFLHQPGVPGIAWWAHFGGFVCGAILIAFVRKPDFPLFHPARVIPKGRHARALADELSRDR